jgi:16S rRNA G966 N2-methylase RsmD
LTLTNFTRTLCGMAKKAAAQKGRADLRVSQDAQQRVPATKLKPSSLLDTRVIYCGDNLEQLAKLPDTCVDLIYIDPPFNSNRNHEVFWAETREKRAFEDRHATCKLIQQIRNHIRLN